MHVAKNDNCDEEFYGEGMMGKRLVRTVVACSCISICKSERNVKAYYAPFAGIADDAGI